MLVPGNTRINDPRAAVSRGGGTELHMYGLHGDCTSRVLRVAGGTAETHHLQLLTPCKPAAQECSTLGSKQNIKQKSWHLRPFARDIWCPQFTKG